MRMQECKEAGRDDCERRASAPGLVLQQFCRAIGGVPIVRGNARHKLSCEATPEEAAATYLPATQTTETPQ